VINNLSYFQRQTGKFMLNKTVLITGITGQDGAYLAQKLIHEGYRVIGTHWQQKPNVWRLEALNILNEPNLILRQHDLEDLQANHQLIQQTMPDEVYNLAAISTLAAADQAPYKTSLINALAPVSFLDAILNTNKNIRFFQASSAEIFGTNRSEIQTEETKLHPANAYALSKAYSHNMVEFYRLKHGLFACNGILYNHESPLRGHEFVTRKITSGLAKLSKNHNEYIEIGNLDAHRDWGHARDYVEAMSLTLSAKTPDTYILSTGRMESVRTFISLACKAMNIPIKWRGSGNDEVGINQDTGHIIVRVNPKYYRPEPSNIATGSPNRAFEQLGWKASVNLTELCNSMVTADLSTH
jgi:GDPmannose 4,6-dehydratase